jgi:THO complex subunit 4
MQSTVGPVKTVQMAYNAQGKSTGVATVVFKNRGDGNKAHGACKLILIQIDRH